MQLYGIPNCDTVRKARAYLEARGIAYEFHDFKKQGVDAALLSEWLRQVGWQKLLKKTGPTWAKLAPADKDRLNTDVAALELLQAQTNLIRRPVLVRDGVIAALGFDPQEYARLFP